MTMISLGYTVTIYGSNSYHAFKCDRCNEIVYDISEKATACKCEGRSDVRTHGTQDQGNRTKTPSDAEGSE